MQQEYTSPRVGDRIRRVIQARGQSMRSFADQANIPYRSLQDYVSGKNKPGFDQLQKMASIGIDVSFLLTGVYGGGILRTFSDQIDRAVLLSSDNEVAKLIFDGAIAAANQVNDTRILAGSSPMTARAILDTIVYSLSVAVQVSAEMDDSLVDLRKRGVSASAVTQIVTEAVSNALQVRVSELVAT